MVGIIIDIVVIIFIVISALIGYKKGLSDIIINIIGIIVALILAFSFKGVVADFIESKTGIASTLKESISTSIKNSAEEKLNISIGNNEENILNEEKKDEIEKNQEDEKKEDIKEEQVKENDKKTNPFIDSLVEKMGVEQGVDNISEKVVNFIMQTACFIGIFAVVYLCTFILKMMLNIVFKLPILSTINKTGGLVASIIISIIKLWVILGIISFLSPVFPAALEFINGTHITKILYNTNLIIMLLSGGLKF